MVYRVVATPKALRVCVALALLATPLLAAQARPLFGNPPIDEAAATLLPGQFVLDDNSETPLFQSSGYTSVAPITIAISTELQRLYVYRGDTLVAVSTISTGKPGHRTPMGHFTILEKQRWHRSNIYSNAPMPFMQRLTWSGIAIHAGHNPGFPASHGCIRIPFGFAQTLFGMTNIGEAVVVTDYPLHAPVVLEVIWADLDATDDMASDMKHDATVWLEYDMRIFALNPGR